MTSKAPVLIAAALISVAAMVLMVSIIDQDNGRNDYTILGSTDNLKAGATFIIVTDDGEKVQHDRFVIDSLEDGMVTYIMYSEIHDAPLEPWITLDTFSPSKIGFDYTDPDKIPEGMQVDRNGDAYTIRGKEITESAGMVFTRIYDPLYIEYDGEKVLSVEGSKILINEGDDFYIYSTTDFRTVDGALIGTVDDYGEVKNEFEIERMYGLIVTPFERMDISMADVSVMDGKYRGFDVKMYTMNGTVDNEEYDYLKVYVYNRYIIMQKGKFWHLVPNSTYPRTFPFTMIVISNADALNPYDSGNNNCNLAEMTADVLKTMIGG